MRIVIDLQSCQSSSKRGGIGRYSMELAKAMAAQPRDHDLWLALSALLPSSVGEIRSTFSGLIASDQIQIFDLPSDILSGRAQPARVRAAEIIREDFLQCLRPDFVHVTSLFEGFAEDVATSVGQLFPGTQTAVTVYDLIPLVQSARYLPDNTSRYYYERKIENIKTAGLLLAISEFSRQEAIDLLGVHPDQVVNISSAADERFKPIIADPQKSARLLSRYGIRRQFLMYTASFDMRKNQSNLVSAFSLLPRELRKNFQLVIVGNGSEEAVHKLSQLAEKSGLEQGEVIFPGHIVDTDLVALYNLCHLFVLPSLAEGFGLPALEAMSCGTATIGSNLTSLPEVIGWSEALFDPTSPERIAKKIHQALTDPGFLQALRERGLEQAKKFSWRRTADNAFNAFESQVTQNNEKKVDQTKKIRTAQTKIFNSTDGLENVVKRLIELDGMAGLRNEELMEIAVSIASNRTQLERVFAS